MTQKNKDLDFDTIIKELNSIITRMEQGDLKLEESIELFKKGMFLTSEGEKKLKEAQHQVDILIKNGISGLKTQPFEE